MEMKFTLLKKRDKKFAIDPKQNNSYYVYICFNYIKLTGKILQLSF